MASETTVRVWVERVDDATKAICAQVRMTRRRFVYGADVFLLVDAATFRGKHDIEDAGKQHLFAHLSQHHGSKLPYIGYRNASESVS